MSLYILIKICTGCKQNKGEHRMKKLNKFTAGLIAGSTLTSMVALIAPDAKTILIALGVVIVSALLVNQSYVK